MGKLVKFVCEVFMSDIDYSLPMKEIENLCNKWQIKEFALFGSILRKDFVPGKSDIDVLITFQDGVKIGWDIVDLHEEISNIFQCEVDILEKSVIEKSKNPYRKEEILKSYEVIYEQAA